MKEKLILACECGATLKYSSLKNREYDTVLDFWKALHEGHEEVTCAEANTIRYYEIGRIKRLDTKTLAARVRVADWIAEERREYADKKYADDTTSRDMLIKDMQENGISADSEWWTFITNYLRRAQLLDIRTPQGAQAFGKVIVTMLHCLETAELERVLPKPGVPSGEIDVRT